MKLLFVYGTLQRGYGNNARLRPGEGGTFLGRATTQKAFMLLHNGAFPGMVEEPGDCCVSGELYAIDSHILESCDRLEGHPNFYKRKSIKVKLPEAKGKNKTFTAYTYFIQNPSYHHWMPISGGSWPPKHESQRTNQTSQEAQA